MYMNLHVQYVGCIRNELNLTALKHTHPCSVKCRALFPRN